MIEELKSLIIKYAFLFSYSIPEQKVLTFKLNRERRSKFLSETRTQLLNIYPRYQQRVRGTGCGGDLTSHSARAPQT